MEKIFIENRKGQKMSVVVEEHSDAKGLAFVMHGLGGFKEQPHIQMFKDAFKEKGFTTVVFDTTNTFGESEGNYEDATTTNYYEDLSDVIAWAKGQSWYQEPFALAGHSLGGISTAYYAEQHPEEVLALAPIATVVSGPLRLEAYEKYDPESLKEWERTGWRVSESESKPGLIKRLKWSHMADRNKYDLLVSADKLTMPTLFIVGSEDTGTLPEHQQILHDAVKGPREIHIIKGAPHTFRDEQHLAEIKSIFLDWIDSWQK